MKKLLDANKELDKLELWLSLCTWKVMSGVMFPRIPYGVAWSKYMEKVHGMGEYAWAKAIWLVLVEAVEKMQPKLEGPILNVQINGFSVLIQVWFYEHTTQFVKHDQGRFTRLASWDNVDHKGRYDAFELVAAIKESEGVPTFEERLERVGEALRAEQGKHDTWHQPTVNVGILTPNDAGQYFDKGAINEAYGGQAKVHNGHMP
ncbi:LOW QUALITY PROTEIN: hypothetical protein Cgig2_025780 [Carnegiea gigantea]|uniref:Aminotransferase-like plant mobile domain-containing protein n=1 Tax=Carnegiea gigantea TaxID=171969 RepID=A0A9Q1JM36_9CARY|nr:LOW QUALITY PROTEIN: hypothetical protein Cgig2_025780 [Carnegiea gigantea]